MQCINVRCNVPMLYATYHCCIQCINVGCNVPLLDAMYQCYMQSINVPCIVSLLYAVYQRSVHCITVIWTVSMVDAMHVLMLAYVSSLYPNARLRPYLRVSCSPTSPRGNQQILCRWTMKESDENTDCSPTFWASLVWKNEVSSTFAEQVTRLRFL